MLPFTCSSSILRQDSSYSINFMCFPSSFPYRQFIACAFECYILPYWLWRRLGETAIVLYTFNGCSLLFSLPSVLSSNCRCVCVSLGVIVSFFFSFSRLSFLIFTLAKIENCCCRFLFDFILYRKLS